MLIMGQTHSGVHRHTGDYIEVLEEEEMEPPGFWPAVRAYFLQIFGGHRRKRKRDDDAEGPVRRPSKLLRLDASTEVENVRTVDAYTEVDVRLTGDIGVQTEVVADEGKTTLIEENVGERTREWLDYPFLVDPRSIQHLQASRTLVILRGLPGSGKSTTVAEILRQFPQGVCCSADFYHMKDGVYAFKVENLKYAHASCQEGCQQFCREGRALILVDNTNVKYWEMAPYIKLAEQYRYTVVLVEPRTPWRMNVDELAQRNRHDVPRDVIAKRVHEYQLVTPKYFGWFINQGDSQLLIQTARQLLLSSLLYSKDFMTSFAQFSGCESVEEMLAFYSRENCQGSSQDILHITSKFFMKGDNSDYMQREALGNNLGKTSVLRIVGFCVTSQTFGAKVELSSEQLGLWAQNDCERPRPPQNNKSKNGGMKNPPPLVKTFEVGFNDDDAEIPLSSVRLSSTRLKTVGSQEQGRRAHLTIGMSGGTRPVQTGLDTVETMFLLQSGSSVSSTNLPSGGSLIQLKSNHWFIQLDRCILVNAMFTGSY